MNGERAYVWAQVFAAKLTIHGFSIADAAKQADEALVEFDKRDFDGVVALEVKELNAVIVRLEGEVAERQQQNEKDTEALLAAEARIAGLASDLEAAKADLEKATAPTA